MAKKTTVLSILTILYTRATYGGAGNKKKLSSYNVFALKALEQPLKTQLPDVKTYKRPTNGIFQRLPFKH